MTLPQALSVLQYEENIISANKTDNTTLVETIGKVANLTGAYSCIPNAKYLPWTKRNPSLQDCGGALRGLPSSGDIRTFSLSAVYPYELPIDRVVGSCKVTVEFTRYASSARSSWTEIGLAGTEMALACMKGTDTGGTTTTGDQDKFR